MSPETTVAQPKSVGKRVGQSRLGTLLVLAVTAAVVMGGAYWIDRPAAATTGVSAVDVGPGDGPAPKIGSPAHDFNATTVDGKQVSLSSYKGHPVWLTFGASWCADCQAEAPDIEATYKKHQAEGVVVLSVSISKSEDNATVLDYGKRLGLTFPQIADPNDTIASAYRVNGIPAHFFIDKSGVLQAMQVGLRSPDQMEAALKGINR
jgi:cytochrome c biogenesis protein CcmG, thiol:disulfide interchange protein DsbE